MTEPAAPPPSAPQPAKRPSGAASCLAVTVAAGGALVVCCTGLLALGWGTTLRQQADDLDRRLERPRADVANIAETDALLDEIAQRVEAIREVERVFPPTLPEAPPEDPWGTTLSYEVSGPDRAWLRSAGPDRELGTSDDLVRTLTPR